MVNDSQYYEGFAPQPPVFGGVIALSPPVLGDLGGK
jgi:hypothetical protein